jgi:transposase
MPLPRYRIPILTVAGLIEIAALQLIPFRLPFTALEAQIAALDAEIKQRSKSDPTARRLMTIPGVGPIVSTAITALVPAAEGFPAGAISRPGSD